MYSALHTTSMSSSNPITILLSYYMGHGGLVMRLQIPVHHTQSPVALTQSSTSLTGASEACIRLPMNSLNFEYVYLFVVAGGDNDLEYYVRECGDIFGVTRRLPPDKRTGKHILEYALAQLVEFKRSGQVYTVYTN